MHSQIFSIAPMMDWTDRHCRYFLRLISPKAWLYTEMITADAVLHGDRNTLLSFHPQEHPLVLQLGGSDPHKLAQCAKIAVDYGYQEINLNIGCPSDRVQAGRFGACLMKEPYLVSVCVSAMKQVVDIPITIKTRIGVDDNDSIEELENFIHTLAMAGVNTFIIHARKAWLKGLSPKENREIPPLRYDVVYQLKKKFPHLKIIINGGIKTAKEVAEHLQNVDGVMIGREAYQNPYILAEMENIIWPNEKNNMTRLEIMEAFFPYVEEQLAKGERLHNLTRHILGLVHGQPGARHWRRFLSEQVQHKNSDVNIIKQAIEVLR